MTPTALRPRGLPAELLGSRVLHHDGLRRGVRAAIAVPAAGALSVAVAGDTQAPLYALLGAFWLMIFTEFPGNRQNRAVGYLGLGCNGLILIAVGTTVARSPWLAVVLTFVLGAAITLSGVISETVSAGRRTLLLLYLWPACTSIGPVGPRLGGYVIALAICIPTALFLLAPQHRGALRRDAAAACMALANRLDSNGSAADVTTEMDALRADFLATNVRPVGLTAGSRALVRVVDNLQILSDHIDDASPAALGPITPAATEVLRRCATMLMDRSTPEHDAGPVDLDGAVTRLRSVADARYRDDARRILNEADDDTAVALAHRVLSRHIVVTAISLTGSIVAAAARADARPVWARALGLRLPKTVGGYRLLPEPAVAAAIPAGLLATRSIAARNSIRAGLGLALAVAVSHLFSAHHGFWVALGTTTVLGTSASRTGTKVIHAVIGTAVGVTISGVLIEACGVAPTLLWMMLPLSVFGAAYLPRSSFIASEAAAAMTALVILNLIAPTGWRLGLLRIEDVALGAVVAVVASLLLWPRGATAAVSKVIDAAVAVNARYLNAAVLRVTRGIGEQPDRTMEALRYYARAANRAADDAVRQYLSETGSQTGLKTPIVAAANRSTRLSLTAELIADIQPTASTPNFHNARSVLEGSTRSVVRSLHTGAATPGPAIIDEFVPALRSQANAQASVDTALMLMNVAANLGELEQTLPGTFPGHNGDL